MRYSSIDNLDNLDALAFTDDDDNDTHDDDDERPSSPVNRRRKQTLEDGTVIGASRDSVHEISFASLRASSVRRSRPLSTDDEASDSSDIGEVLDRAPNGRPTGLAPSVTDAMRRAAKALRRTTSRDNLPPGWACTTLNNTRKFYFHGSSQVCSLAIG